MVLGGRPPGRVGHCQRDFSFNISHRLFICVWIVYNTNCRLGWWTRSVCPDFKKEEREAYGLIQRSFCRFFYWVRSLLGRVCIPAEFLLLGTFHAERRWLVLASVNLRNGESQDSLLKRFRKKVVKSGVLSTVRRKRWFVSKSEQRRMEKKKAIRRIKRRTFTKETE